MRLAVLGSTRGTNLKSIVEAIQQNILPAQIEIVISNKADAGILKQAKAFALSTLFLDPTGLSREAYDEKISNSLQEHAIDLIILIGYMRIISTDFISKWKNKVINVHPSLLPAFAGKIDAAVHEAVLKAGVKETGCTVHFVTEEIDAGPIILQKKCKVYQDDTVSMLKTRVQELEAQALVEVLQKLCINKFLI